MHEHRNVIVTGSTSGIGLAIAEAFAAQGANVVINGLGDPDEVEAIRRRMADEFGVQVIYSPADMSKPEQIRNMAAMALDAFGKVDVVVNNAGIQHVAPVESFPEEKWDAILAINLSAAFHLIKGVLPSMKTVGFGRIINIASAHGLTASPFKSAYIAAKHGLIGLSKTVALETAELGVTCNTICPGYVKTPLVEAQIADQAKAYGIAPEAVVRDVMLVHQARKEFVEVGELAALATFLASDSAASITGAAIAMDGGWTLH
jgi:3-hydroxybutyrate dehydrogenase